MAGCGCVGNRCGHPITVTRARKKRAEEDRWPVKFQPSVVGIGVVGDGFKDVENDQKKEREQNRGAERGASFMSDLYQELGVESGARRTKWWRTGLEDRHKAN